MKSNILRSKIVAAGYTQKSLASELDMSQNTLSKKINGKAVFNTDEIGRICELLGIVDDSEKVYIFL